jgi:hypothetical protein
MSFQNVINYAETISIDTKQVVASTQSRDGTYRAVSRGGQYWRFEVKLPDGPSWTEWRTRIAELERLDRVTSGSFQLNTANMEWLYQYQGDSANYTGFVATITQGSKNILLTTSPTTSSGYKFRAGDFIQLGSSGKVYKVESDVPYTSNSVTLHRPVIDSSASNVALRVAENCVFTVYCRDLPNWTIFARDQISWSGPFVFVEA